MTAEHTDDFYQEEYDDYIENTPLEARFDYLTIQMVVTEAFPKHEAYGMLFKEYNKERMRISKWDESEKKRLSSRFPSYFSHIATDIALLNGTSIYRTMILLVELGMIHFQVDYREEYKEIRDARNALYKGITTEDDKRVYQLVEKHKIEINAAGGKNSNLFVPHVPEWLYNAASDVKGYLNMSMSDFVFFCWCYGCINCFEEGEIPAPIKKDIKKVCDGFDFEIRACRDRLVTIRYPGA